jgi:pimeloyl-ACP methyl ester carboxylesterase
MGIEAIGALGKVLLSNGMRTEIQDISLLFYRDIPAANSELRKMNGNVGEYDVFSPDTRHSISYWGNRLSQYLRQVAEKTGRPVFLVAHSRGSEIARDAIQIAGADQYVDILVELAPPNNGTKPEEFEPLERFRDRIRDRYVLDDITPGNPYLTALNSAPAPRTQVYNVHSIDDSDWLIPHPSSHLEWTENIEYENKRHNRYLADQEVTQFIAEVYPPNAPIVYVHGLHDLLSIMLEGTVFYPLPAQFAVPLLVAQERYIAREGFRPIHAAIAETGKMKAQLKAVA